MEKIAPFLLLAGGFVSWSNGSYSTITITQLETDVLVSHSSGV